MPSPEFNKPIRRSKYNISGRGKFTGGNKKPKVFVGKIPKLDSSELASLTEWNDVVETEGSSIISNDDVNNSKRATETDKPIHYVSSTDRSEERDETEDMTSGRRRSNDQEEEEEEAEVLTGIHDYRNLYTRQQYEEHHHRQQSPSVETHNNIKNKRSGMYDPYVSTNNEANSERKKYYQQLLSSSQQSSVQSNMQFWNSLQSRKQPNSFERYNTSRTTTSNSDGDNTNHHQAFKHLTKTSSRVTNRYNPSASNTHEDNDNCSSSDRYQQPLVTPSGTDSVLGEKYLESSLGSNNNRKNANNSRKGEDLSSAGSISNGSNNNNVMLTATGGSTDAIDGNSSVDDVKSLEGFKKNRTQKKQYDESIRNFESLIDMLTVAGSTKTENKVLELMLEMPKLKFHRLQETRQSSDDEIISLIEQLQDVDKENIPCNDPVLSVCSEEEYEDYDDYDGEEEDNNDDFADFDSILNTSRNFPIVEEGTPEKVASSTALILAQPSKSSSDTNNDISRSGRSEYDERNDLMPLIPRNNDEDRDENNKDISVIDVVKCPFNMQNQATSPKSNSSSRKSILSKSSRTSRSLFGGSGRKSSGRSIGGSSKGSGVDSIASSGRNSSLSRGTGGSNTSKSSVKNHAKKLMCIATPTKQKAFDEEYPMMNYQPPPASKLCHNETKTSSSSTALVPYNAGKRSTTSNNNDSRQNDMCSDKEAKELKNLIIEAEQQLQTLKSQWKEQVKNDRVTNDERYRKKKKSISTKRTTKAYRTNYRTSGSISSSNNSISHRSTNSRNSISRNNGYTHGKEVRHHNNRHCHHSRASRTLNFDEDSVQSSLTGNHSVFDRSVFSRSSKSNKRQLREKN